MALQLTISEDKGVVVINMVGRIDSFSIEELNTGFDEVMKTGKKYILLIMKDLEYINSRGLGALISFFKWVKNVGGLVKIAEVPLNIMQVFNLLGLDGLTLIYDSSSDAMESFKRQQSKTGRKERYEIDEEMDIPIRPRAPKQSKMPYVFASILFLVLLGIVLLRAENRTPSSGNLQPIENRLEFLEQKLVRIEDRTSGIPKLANQINGMTKKLSGRVKELSADVESLRKKANTPSVNPAKTSSRSSVSSAKRNKIYHKVRAGESLYRIARQYKISMSELSRLNGINPKKYIYPGQKLFVGFSEGR